MRATVTVQLAGAPAPAPLCDALQTIEVQENADAPGTLTMRVPVNRTYGGDLQFVGDQTFEPYTHGGESLVIAAPGQAAQCVFDGYVLSWHLHLDRTSGTSTLELWAQDASWLLSIGDKVREWSGMTDGDVANQIFGEAGFATTQANTMNDSPQRSPDTHTLLQRGTDLQFLRGLARRNGKLCRVASACTPGARTGYFVTPDVGGDPVATIDLADPNAWTVNSLDFDWDVLRPSAVDASQVPLDSDTDDSVSGDATDSGLAPLATRTYCHLRRAAADAAAADGDRRRARPALPQRGAALRESGLVRQRCRGESDLERLGQALRAGTVVKVQGAGTLHSGNWFVWNVRHTITPDAVKAAFTLVRNAIGPPAQSGWPGGCP